MKFEEKYFIKLEFSREQILKNINNSLRDFAIAKKDTIPEVKFNYAYTAFIKAGIALLSYYHIKVKGSPGHHVKIIEKMSELTKNNDLMDMGNIMRSKRNLDLYSGGIDITEKEIREYIKFVENVINKIKKIIVAE